MNGQDMFYSDSPVLRQFVAHVRHMVDTEPDKARVVERLRPAFGELLRDQTWLSSAYQEPDLRGGMGGGIGNYLVYRSADRDLTINSLVLPTGSKTPVHDHLAWGLVGVYAGEQDEWIYRRLDDGSADGSADLEEVERRHLGPGEFYDLLPPDGDIHRVETTGPTPSISIHLLGNDIGCVWRHRYEPAEHTVRPFRSSYSNQPCEESESPASRVM